MAPEHPARFGQSASPFLLALATPHILSSIMEAPKKSISQDGAIHRLAMWEKGVVKNPHDTSFVLNNLNSHCDIPCSSSDKAGLWQLVQQTDTQKVLPFVVTEN
jgi:hypothetical protein